MIGHADRAEPLNDYCLGLILPGGLQECRAFGSGDGANAGIGQASVAIAFHLPSVVVGRDASGGSSRLGAAADRVAWADRGVDRRRHRISQEGAGIRSGSRGNIAVSLASSTPGCQVFPRHLLADQPSDGQHNRVQPFGDIGLAPGGRSRTSAAICSLMLTCRACGVEPLAWLRHALTQLPQRAVDADIDDLLHFNFAKSPLSNPMQPSESDPSNGPRQRAWK